MHLAYAATREYAGARARPSAFHPFNFSEYPIEKQFEAVFDKFRRRPFDRREFPATRRGDLFYAEHKDRKKKASAFSPEEYKWTEREREREREREGGGGEQLSRS